MANPSSQGKIFGLGESGAVVPLLTDSASAPSPSLPAPVSPHKVFPKTAEFRGCSPPHLIWEMSHRAREFRVIKCYPLVVLVVVVMVVVVGLTQ